MTTTIAKLRAVVSAETDDASRQVRAFGQTVTDTSRSTEQSLGRIKSVLSGDLSGALAGLGASAAMITTAAVAAKVAVSLDDARQKAANVRRELTAYAGGAEQARAATEALLRATDGGVSRLDAMSMSSRLLGMGLATTAEQVGQLSRMAVLLGDKTLSVQARMESWNAMLANQSIERLDTFGISSGRVRQRIDELMAANAGLAREQAFVNAVLEIGGEKLQAVEAEGVTAASSLDKVGAAVANLKQAAAERINVEVQVNWLAKKIDWAAHWLSDEGAAKQAYARAFEEYNRASQQVANIQEQLAGWYARVNPLARANYENKLEEAQAAEAAARAHYEYAEMMFQVEQGTYNLVDAERDYIAAMDAKYGAVTESATALAAAQKAAETETSLVADALEKLRGKELVLDANAAAAAIFAGRMTEAELAALGLKGALDMLDSRAASAAGREHLGLTELRAGNTLSGLSEPTPVVGSKAWNEQQATQDRIAQLRQEMEDKKRANEQVAKSAASSWKSSMTDALNDLTSDMKSKLAQGMQFSVGLSDLRPGGSQGPNAPGQNGAFEDIYRLQAFVQNGTWGETAAKYGVDQAGAKDIIQKFQTGMWDQSVMQMIDKTKLTEQIQQAQLGQAMMDAVAADLAKASGSDPKLIKAMLGLGGAADGAGAAAKLDLGGQLVPSLASAIDAELLTKGAELEKRGGAAWDLLEGGMLAKARKSDRFGLMVESMVDNALAKYVPTS